MRWLITFTITVAPLFLNAQTLDWAGRAGGTGTVSASAIVVDDKGNVYSAGSFSGKVDFDPGVAVRNYTTVGAGDIFIQKLNASGEFVWTKQIGTATYTDLASSMKLDENGNLYVGGYFWRTVNFGPGATLTSSGFGDGFVLKIDTAGNFHWVVQINGSLEDVVHSIALDRNGDVYAGGIFNNNATAFIKKISSSGNLLWTKNFASPDAITSADKFSTEIDPWDNIYNVGSFRDSADFDPGTGVFILISNGDYDIFIQKLDSAGNFLWAKSIGGGADDIASSCVIDSTGNLYSTGYFTGTVDFDPGSGIFNLSFASNVGTEFILKLDSAGIFTWVRACGSPNGVISNSIVLDNAGYIYATGNYGGTVDFDPGQGSAFFNSIISGNLFIQKLDAAGNFIWTISTGGIGYLNESNSITVDGAGTVYTNGQFINTSDFDPGPGTFKLTATAQGGGHDLFVQKILQKGVFGYVFKDFNDNCQPDITDLGFQNRLLTLNPGNIIVQANAAGFWTIDSIQPGTYTIAADTSSGWINTCPFSQNFTVTNPQELTRVPDFGLKSLNPCPSPEISLSAGNLRPCNTATLNVMACNENTGTAYITNPFAVVQLDSNLTLQSASLPYTSLGNSTYRFQLSTIVPGNCISFSITCLVKCSVRLGQTVCMNAKLTPVASCMLDTVPGSYPSWISTCATPWDGSILTAEASCLNDSIFFTVKNTATPGSGNMTCFAPVMIFTDSFLVRMDSVKLTGGQSQVFAMIANGRTNRLEVYQHPLHPGNSIPRVTIEACGSINNWTPNFVTVYPQNDADPVVDFYCGQVLNSFDPNDKTGFPTGATSQHYIKPNQQLQYVIRFQNTGNDTAYNVVIRDTLDEKFDIFSVAPGASSHSYTFQIYGPRVLEWTFYNITLPDSFVHNSGSQGFLTYHVNQTPDLPDGTVMQNSAAIYFDYNPPVITNVTTHTINDLFFETISTCSSTSSAVSQSACGNYNWNGQVITQSGTYSRLDISSAGCDSVSTLHLTINNSSSFSLTESTCISYTLNNQTYSASGVYTQTLNNVNGCDSVITLNLTINNPSSLSLNDSACDEYSLNNQTYTSSGTYSQTLVNSSGCDSTITLDLTINENTAATFNESSCSDFTFNGQTFTTSGTYSLTLPNTAGCDSSITLNLTINHIDTTAAQNGNVLTAIAAQATYQWIDCNAGNAPLSGESNQTFIAAVNGKYAVIITQNSCSDTSDCYVVNGVGIEESKLNSLVNIVPNPNKSNINIIIHSKLVGVEYFVLDVLGKVIQSGRLNDVSTTIDLENLRSGIYLLQINSVSNRVFKIVKH